MKKNSRVLVFPLAFAFCLAFFCCDRITSPPFGSDDVGLSGNRLERIDKAIQKSIDDHRLAGGVALVYRHGHIAYFKAFGMMDMESQKPMQTDTIFRICSMTKPITAVAVMMLYEEGYFTLNEPVYKKIPELKNMKVLEPSNPEDGSSPPDRLVKAKRPITIYHLLTHTSGLTYNWNPRVGHLYNEHKIGHGLIQQEGTIGESVKRLLNVPLLFHPGDDWEYSISDDVLGYLVEVVSGMTYEEFLRKRVFEPLGMTDTQFFLAGERVSRLATAYAYSGDKGLHRVPDEPQSVGQLKYTADYPYNGPKTFFSGGAGLCSTAADYLKFCQMLLNGGELNGIRLLSRKSVELISQDHISGLDEGFGYGLSFGTYSEASQLKELGSIGAYYWGGFYYTSFVIDPKEELITIFLGQLFPAGDLNLRNRVMNLAYQAIID